MNTAYIILNYFKINANAESYSLEHNAYLCVANSKSALVTNIRLLRKFLLQFVTFQVETLFKYMTHIVECQI